jgi:membrane protein YqaA with SNARE-associated domain
VIEQAFTHASTLGGLFLWSLLAATLVPLSSEAALSAAHVMAAAPAWLLFVAALAGNVCGALINWILGVWCLRFQHRRWFPVTPAQLHRAETRFRRWGGWILLFSWIPVIGDPLTFAAGALRYPLARFLIVVTAGKAARYAAILWITDVVLPIFTAS